MPHAFVDKIRAARDLPAVAVPTPEWPDVSLFVRRLSARELLDLGKWSEDLKRSAASDGEKQLEAVAHVLVLCTVDDRGAQVFGDEDAALPLAKSPEVVGRIFEAAATLNKLTEQARADVRGNSPAAVAPPTASPSPSESPTLTPCLPD